MGKAKSKPNNGRACSNVTNKFACHTVASVIVVNAGMGVLLSNTGIKSDQSTVPVKSVNGTSKKPRDFCRTYSQREMLDCDVPVALSASNRMPHETSSDATLGRTKNSLVMKGLSIELRGRAFTDCGTVAKKITEPMEANDQQTVCS